MDGKMRLLCSYGGCVVARPNDGRLRYSGGESRIVVVPRDVSYRNLVSKLKELYDFKSGSGIRLQFQMPDADLDALVCVTCDEELRHVIDAYLLRDTITDVKIRVFVSVSAPAAQSSKELQFPLDLRGYAAATEQGQLESMRPVSNGQSEISKAPLLSEDRRIRATATIKSELSTKEDKSSGGVSIVSEAELAPKCTKEAAKANLSQMKVLEANCPSLQTKDSFQGYPVSGKNDVPVQPSELPSATTSCPQASFGIPTVGTLSSSINRNHGNNSQHYSQYPWHLDGLAYHNQQHLPTLYCQDPSVRNIEEKTSSSNRNNQHGRFPSAGDINVEASSISNDNLHGRSPSASNIDVESSSINRNNEHGRSPSASNIEINPSSLSRNYDNGTAGFVFETGLGGQNSQQHVPFLYSAYPCHLDDPACIYQEHLPSVYFQNPSASNIETEASSVSKNDQYSLSPSTSNSEIEASLNDRNNENGAGGFLFEVGLGGQHSKQYSAYPFHLDGPACLNQHDLPSLYYHNPSYSSTVTDQGQVCILNPQHYRLDGFDSSDRRSQYLPGRQAELFNNKHSWIENAQTHRGVLDHKQNLASHDSSQQLSNNIAAPHQADVQNSLASSPAGSFGNHGNNQYIQGPWAFREQDSRFDYVDRQERINMSVPNVQAAPESSIPVQLPENLMNQYVIAHQDPVFSSKNSRQVDKSYCEGDNVHLKHSSDTWINQPLMDAPVSEFYQKQAHGHSQDHNIDSSYLNHYDGGFYLLPQHLPQPELKIAPDGTKFAADRYLLDQAKDDHFWNLNSRFLSGTHSSDESLVSSMETKCTIEDRDKLDLRTGKFQLDNGDDQFGNDFHRNGVNMFAFSDPEKSSGNGHHDYSNLEKRKAVENPVLSLHTLNSGNESLNGDFNLAASNTGESQTDSIERNDVTGSENLHRIPTEDNSITTSSQTDMQKPSTFRESRAVMAETSSPLYEKDTEGSLATGLPSTESHQQTECSDITQIDSKLNEMKLSKEDIFLEINSRINQLGVGSNKTASSRDSSFNYPSNMFSLAFSICHENGKAIAKNETKEVNSLGYMKNSTEGTLMLDQDNFRETSMNENEGLDMSVSDLSVETAKNLAIEAEQQALAKGLQTINNADLEEIRELGSGTYGTVYHGRWKGSDVAIKRIKASCFEGSPADRAQLVADFWKEASILSQLHHPNVVSFYGVVRDSPSNTLATVTEYMANGSLKQVLRKKDRTIDLRKRFILAMDAAFGMEYLHGKNIVHFDLKCDNLLVNIRDSHRPICKIGDLGLSKVKHQTLVSGGVRGTLPWMAPELLSGDSRMVTDKVDVYSFAIVMWEILTGEEPYANMHCGSIIGGIMTNTLRPTIPTCCEPSWRSLMEKCWSNDPRQRPTFSEISKELRAIAAQQKWC